MIRNSIGFGSETSVVATYELKRSSTFQSIHPCGVSKERLSSHFNSSKASVSAVFLVGTSSSTVQSVLLTSISRSSLPPSTPFLTNRLSRSPFHRPPCSSPSTP